MEEALQVTIWHVHKADAEKEQFRLQLQRIYASVRQLLDGAAALDAESRASLLRVLQMAAPSAEGSETPRDRAPSIAPSPREASPVPTGCLDKMCDTLEDMA